MLDFFNNDWLLPEEVESNVLIPNMENNGEDLVEEFGLTRQFEDDI